MTNKPNYLFVCAVCKLFDNCYRARRYVINGDWCGCVTNPVCDCINFNEFDPMFAVGGCFICGDISVVKSFRNKHLMNGSMRFFGVCSQHIEIGKSLIEEIEKQTQAYLSKYSGKRRKESG